MQKRVNAEYALLRAEHEAWYRAEVRRNHEQTYALLLAIVADSDGLSTDIGQLMAFEQELSEREEKFDYTCTQEISAALDKVRCELQGRVLDFLRGARWPDEECALLKRRLDAHAQGERRRRKEMLALADSICTMQRSIVMLRQGSDFLTLDKRLRALHSILCDKRATFALLHCPTPLPTSAEEPR